MKPPRSLKVGPHVYRVVTVPDGVLEGAGACATCTPTRLVISLDGGQPASQMADSLLHELSHAILDAVRLDDDVEEQVCLALGPGLLALLLDNPELYAYLTASKETG